MKHTKRALATILAVLMAIGMFAASASALSVAPDAPSLFEARTVVPANADNEAALDAFELDLMRAIGNSYGALDILFALRNYESARRPGANIAEFITAGNTAGDAFMAAMFGAGVAIATLEGAALDTELARLIRETVTASDAAMAVARNVFNADALAFANAFGRYYELIFRVDASHLTEDELDALSAQMRELDDPFDDELWDNEDWAALARAMDRYVGQLEGILRAAGLLPPLPTFWARLWNFILRWIFFGWIWM